MAHFKLFYTSKLRLLNRSRMYTDTHGYTEINFAAFAMLGRRFCPRIRGVQHQRIYRIDRDRSYGSLRGLIISVSGDGAGQPPE